MSTSTGLNIIHFTNKLSQYSSITLFVVGTIGNLLNILVFISLKLFRNNQCAFYFTVESISNIFLITNSLAIYLLASMGNYDVAILSILWCKLRSILFVSCTVITLYTICFSAIDQYLSTSHLFFLRQLSTIKLARCLTIIIVIISLLHTIPFVILLDIQQGVCTVFHPQMVNYISYIYYPVLIGFLPMTITLIFSLLAYQNVRRIVRRQIPVVRRRLDQQLTAMVLIRIIIFLILTLPFTCLQMYTYLTKITPSSNSYAFAIENLVSSIVTTLLNLNYAISFYMFCIAFRRFRRQVKHVLIKKYWRRCKLWCFSGKNQVEPQPVMNINSTDSSGIIE
ncbi:unnamed protein product [Adineta steineri]|uniref:G-protein coupled receptors family 1 profile domain-containing protein n=1 Tax=Adineta steineri TaxID=433720 RepID=A0A815I2C3_9BILA|nr:unnamed protein product [Adineta steineri]CAF1362242.1 unnamed protein product [Adineta steineri]